MKHIANWLKMEKNTHQSFSYIGIDVLEVCYREDPSHVCIGASKVDLLPDSSVTEPQVILVRT